jgi:hypothetical protein
VSHDQVSSLPLSHEHQQALETSTPDAIALGMALDLSLESVSHRLTALKGLNMIPLQKNDPTVSRNIQDFPLGQHGIVNRNFRSFYLLRDEWLLIKVEKR